MRFHGWLILWIGLTCLAQQEGMTPELMAQLDEVVESVISPDGDAMAIVMAKQRTPFEDKSGPAWRELHVWDQERGLRPFVTGEVSVKSVAWLPDSRGIAFLAKRGGDEHIGLYIIPLDGGEARCVVKHKTDIKDYAISNDGQHIAFLATRPTDDATKKRKEQGFDQEIYEEELKMTGVWVTSMQAEEEATELEVNGSATELGWSPDGRWLSVALAPTPLVDDFYMNRRVHVIDATNGRVKTRVENPGKMGQVVWSPESDRIAMISGADIHDPSEGRVLIADVESGRFEIHLKEFEGQVVSLAWSTSGLKVLADVGVWSMIGDLNPKTGKMKTLLEDKGPVFASMNTNHDGSVFSLVGDSPNHPREAFLFDEKAVRRVTVSNPELDEVAMGTQEVIRYQARDGLEIEGILIRPLNEKEGQRYPLIMVVHGGPESHYRNGWLTRYSLPGQMGAAAGFAQFYPNYRGSTGRGLKYSKLSQGDPAGSEFNDLVDAVDFLVEKGWVDKDKVGVTGGSYGGYATAWCTTYFSDRFAAGVMFVGISNKTSKAGTTDIPNEEFYVHAMRRVWENNDSWQFFLERSPVYHAHKAKSPLLILHGKDDPRVHPGQSMELYRQLKSKGQAPVRLVFYPGEGHGNRKSAARYDYNLRLLRWMAHYLKGDSSDLPPYALEYPFNSGDNEE